MSQLKSNKVNVVGAGFSGLVTAYYLCRRGYQVDIYEKEDHAGGLIGTHKTSLGLIEQAANAFLATRSLEDICDEIGIGLVSVKKEASRRYLFRKGKPVRWPLSLLGSLRLFVFFIPFLFSRKLFRPSSGESLYSWSKRTMGQEAAEYLVSPAFQGIYGISAQHLSANLVLKFLFKKRIEKGRLKGSVSAEKGMGSFIQAIKEYIISKGGQFHFSKVPPHPQEGFPTFVACDLQSAIDLLQSWGVVEDLLLYSQNSLSLTSVTLQFAKEPAPLYGFGCLLPNKEDFNALGVLFNHSIFPGRVESGFSETWIFSDGKLRWSEMEDHKILSAINSDRRRLFRSEESHSQYRRFSWPERIPHYSPSLELALEQLEQTPLSVILVGNYLGDLGLSKIIELAQKKVDEFAKENSWPQ